MPQSPLTIALVVLRSRAAVGDLPHVVAAVSAFLDRSMELSLARVCSLGSLPLVQRVWDGSHVTVSRSWHPSVLLWSNRHYYRDQFELSMIEAAQLGDLNMVQWLFDHFSGCKVPSEAVEEVARGGKRDILEFLVAYSKVHPNVQVERTFLDEANDEANDEGKSHEVSLWEGDALLAAATAGHTHLITWMLKEMYHGFYMKNTQEVMNQIGRHGNTALMQRLVTRWWRPPRLEFVAEGGHMDMMDWIIEQRFDSGKRWALKSAAANGHLEMIKLLVYEDLEYLEGPAFCAAAENGHLHVLRWFKNKNMGWSTASQALDLAAANGHLEVAKYLYAACGAVGTSKTMRGAAMNGHLAVVQWLYAQFAAFPKVHLFKLASRKQMSITAMDEAAKNGHLHVLKYLQEVATSMTTPTVGNKRKRSTGKGWNGKNLPTCTPAAIQVAAAGGFVDVMQWLHTHYWTEPSTEVMDTAAANGHLPMVQWLHEHTTTGCTSAAMNGAAKGGNLAVVKWLHANRSEGCTKKAMDDAASQGHASVVKWLHENRSEGCSMKAMDGAASGGHFEMVLFLASKRTELCSAGRKYIRNRHISAWMNEKYPDHFISDPNERYEADRIGWTRMIREDRGWQTGI